MFILWWILLNAIEEEYSNQNGRFCFFTNVMTKTNFIMQLTSAAHCFSNQIFVERSSIHVEC